MFNRIARDKWRHFYVGIVMGAFLESFGFWVWPKNVGKVSFLVLIIIIAVSYGFELFSKITGKGRYDFLDAVASVIGGVIGMLAAFTVLLMVQ